MIGPLLRFSVVLLLLEATQSQQQIAWGRPQAGLQSHNLLNMGCKLSTGHPICCNLVSNSTSENLYLASRAHRSGSSRKSHDCKKIKTYYPSPYEQKQLETATKFGAIGDFEKRKTMLINHLISESSLNDSFHWTNRVRAHMQGADVDKHGSELDEYYLSKFVVTSSCRGQETTRTEWIEPLSMHARHPYSLFTCLKPSQYPSHLTLNHMRRQFPRYFSAADNKDNVEIINLDYLLLAQRNVSSSSGRHSSGSSFLFDAGTSTFESSLWWFTCAYLQQNIAFDRIFGWEYTLLEPGHFWAQVPAAVAPKYSFFNTKMSADPWHAQSPLRFIKQLATEEDFVAFKLDIDTPDVEIPTLLQILKDPVLHSLVDEFFFEFHFRCELMMICGWGREISSQSHGLKMERAEVLTTFQALRRAGVRAHFWP